MIRELVDLEAVFQDEVERLERQARPITPYRTGKMRGSWSIVYQGPLQRVLHNEAPYSGFVLDKAASAEGLRVLFS